MPVARGRVSVGIGLDWITGSCHSGCRCRSRWYAITINTLGSTRRAGRIEHLCADFRVDKIAIIYAFKLVVVGVKTFDVSAD